MGSVNANTRSMKLRTILCQAAALSQEYSVALMDKLSLNSAFSWALWILYEANEPIVSEWAKQHCWCFLQLSVKSHHIKLIHLGIRPLLSYWKPVEPHGVGLRAQVPEAARLSSRAAVWPGLTFQLCAPQFGQTTTWPLRFLPAQRDVLSNYNNITIMSFPFKIRALSHFHQGHGSF